MATESLLPFADIDIMPLQKIPLPGIVSDPGSSTVRDMALICLNGYILVTGDRSADNAALFKKNNQWEPEVTWTQTDNQPNGMCYAYVHSDALVLNTSGTTTYAMNLRQTGAARNLNNGAALPGRTFSPGLMSTTGSGMVTFQVLPAAPSATRCVSPVHFEDDRYLIPATDFATDTTYPTVATPSAPVVAAATSGGKLADATYYVRYAWVTKTNSRRTSQGFTIYSAEGSATVSGGAGAGRLDITIPALPSNVIGYVIMVGTATGAANQYVAGGGGAAGTHVCKATMAQLAMKDRFFYHTSTGLQPQTMGTIENLNPVTSGTIRAFTTGLWGNVWSPYFIDPTILWGCPSGGTTKTQKADKFDIVAGTVSLDQTTTWNGEPNITYTTVGNPTTYVNYRSIPELGAYAIYHTGVNLASNPGAFLGTFVQVRSCFNNQLLWSYCLDDFQPYNVQAPSNPIGAIDFETINGITYMMAISRKYRGIVRVPVRIMP